MNTETHRDLALLDAVSVDRQVTQRALAARLGIALGLTNVYLRRLVRKGFIKCVSVKPNRILYLITPQGIAEKTRLTYEYMSHSLQLYKEIRDHMRMILGPIVQNGATRIAIYGTGEAAELTYLSLKEFGLEPAAIFGNPSEGTFLGQPVRKLNSAELAGIDHVIIAHIADPGELMSEPPLRDVSKDKMLLLRPDVTSKRNESK